MMGKSCLRFELGVLDANVTPAQATAVLDANPLFVGHGGGESVRIVLQDLNQERGL